VISKVTASKAGVASVSERITQFTECE